MSSTSQDKHEMHNSRSGDVEAPVTVRSGRAHSALRIVLIVACFLVFAVTMFVMAAAGSGFGREIGLFRNSTGDVDSLFPLQIRPTSATFTIWTFIFIWNGIYLVYMFTTICRQGKSGYYYLYPLIPLPFYVVYLVNCGMLVAWALLWDRLYIEASCVVLFLTSATSYFNIAIIARNMYNLREALSKDAKGREYWLVQAVVLNGLGLYVGWTSVAQFLNLAIVMSYGKLTSVSPATSSTVSLIILFVLIIGYVAADLSILDKYTRYLVSPYISLTAAASGSYLYNKDTASETNRILIPILLGIIVVSFVAKVVSLVVREIRHPILPRPRSS